MVFAASSRKEVRPRDTPAGLFSRMNAVYTTYFKLPYPARTIVGAARLVGGAHIEVTVTAHK